MLKSSSRLWVSCGKAKISPLLSGTLPLNVESRRHKLLQPEKWYFIDTEGTLEQNNVRARYVDKRTPEEEARDRFSLHNVENLLKEMQGDEPLKSMPNPYKRDKQQCILCKYGIEPDYKNARLLSQFVSRWTGMIYERQTTNLCEMQQKKLVEAIKKSRMAGFMYDNYVEPIFYHDPKLFDPFRPARKS